MGSDIQGFVSNADNLTKSINSIQNSIKSLTKDLMSYKKIQDEVFNKRMEVKSDLGGVRKEFKSFFKEVNEGFKESQKAGKAHQKVINEMTQSYKNFTKAAKEAGSAEKSLGESKVQTSGDDTPKDFRGKFKDIIKGGNLLNNVGDSAVNLTNSYMSSIHGDSQYSGIMGSALSGAIAGTAIAPGIGSAIGLVTGAIAGLLNGVAEEIKKKDEFVKNEVKTTFDSIKQSQANLLATGTIDANKTEANEFNFDYLLGHKGNGKEFVNKITEYSASNYYKPQDALNISRSLLVAGYKEKEIEPFLSTVGDTAASLGLSSQDTKALANTLIKATTKQKISVNDLVYLDGLGMDVTKAVAKELKISDKDLERQLSNGSLKGDKVAEILNRHMINNFGGGMARYSETAQAKKDEIKERTDIIEGAAGDGYAEGEKSKLNNQLNYLKSSGAKRQQLAYEKWGRQIAEIENVRADMDLYGLRGLYGSDNIFYKDGKEVTGLDLRLKENDIKSKSDSMFKNSDESKMIQKYDKMLIETIQGNIGADTAYIDNAVLNANQLSLGINGVEEKAKKEGKTHISKKNSESVYSDDYRIKPYGYYAVGLDRVPHDNYPAMLHEGERVLTRVEADQNQSNSVAPIINMYNTVRDDTDIDKIVTALVSQLSKAQGSYGGAY